LDFSLIITAHAGAACVFLVMARVTARPLRRRMDAVKEAAHVGRRIQRCSNNSSRETPA